MSQEAQHSNEDTTTYVLCVVAVKLTPKKEHKNFYLGIKGRDRADLELKRIASKGFVADGERYFPDQIESLTLKVKEDGEQADAAQSGEHQEADS